MVEVLARVLCQIDQRHATSTLVYGRPLLNGAFSLGMGFGPTSTTILLSNVIRTVQDHVRTLAAWGEIYWRESRSGPPPAAQGAQRVADGGLLIQGNDFAGRAEAGPEARLAENLSRHMRLSHETMPYLRWSYYLSTGADLLSVVRWVKDGAQAL